MWVNPQFYADFFTFTKEILDGKFFFVHWYVQVNRQKATVKKKLTYFLEKLCCFFVHIFWKSLCDLQIFYHSMLRCKVFRPFLFLFVWSPIHSIGIFFFARRKYVDLVDISNVGRGRNFCGIFTKLEKLRLHKIFNVGLTITVDYLEFCVFILDVKCA